MNKIKLRTLMVGILIGFGPLIRHAQAAIVTVPLDVFTLAQTDRTGYNINVDFDGATRTINFATLITTAANDPNGDGLLAFPSNNSPSITYMIMNFANGKPANLERVRFLGFTLTGTQAGLDALNNNEILNFEERSGPGPLYSRRQVHQSELQLGFNAHYSSAFTEDVFANSDDGLGKISIFNSNNTNNPNSDIRIKSLRFEMIAVPEPATTALLVSALATLVVLRRRLKHRL